MDSSNQTVTVHRDALELAELLKPSWPILSAQLRRRPTLVCEETPEEKKKREDAEAEAERKKKEEQKPPWGSDDQFNPERAWKLIEGLRGDITKLKTANEELGGKVKTFEDASKSDQEKLTDAKSEADTRATKAELEAARLRVALKKGLTETQAKRLVGDDEDQLEKDADELVASFKAEEDEGDGQEPRRRPKEKLRPGAVPSGEPDETDPVKLAEKVPRMY